MFASRGRVFGIAFLAAASVQAAAHNPYGVQVALTGRAPTEYLIKHYEDAARLVGEWGHIRVGAGLRHPPEQEVIPTLIACRAMRLIPIFTQQSSPEVEGEDPFRPNPDGTYDREARVHEEWARAIYDAGFVVPYYEVGNEPQGRIPPEVHAKWCISVARALHRVDPDIRVSPAGMAGSGAGYYRDMLSAVPELKEHMAVYSCHPYASNRPPQHDDDGLTIQGYRWTLEALRESGVENPRLICTETGWEIGTQGDKRYPYITEDLRAEYIVEAFTRYWAPDPAIVAVTPFMLQSVPWNGWETWDFIREDDTYTEQYKALAAVPKPKGKDYQPAGSATLAGRLVEPGLGVGIRRALVWIVPQSGQGAYAAVTDDEGVYRIADVPAGDYFVSARKRTCSRGKREPVRLSEGETVEKNLALHRVGILRAGFDRGDADGMNAGGFAAYGKNPAVYAWDGEVGHNQPGSLCVSATPEEAGYWIATDYCAGLPGERYAMQVWVKTENYDPGPDGGIEVRFESCNAFMLAHEKSWAPGPEKGTHDWTPVNVTVYAPPKTRRHRVALMVRGRSGRVWFDDVFVGKAELPLPGRDMTARPAAGAALRGRVTAVDDSVLHEATVFTNPGNYHAATNRVGDYEIPNLPPGEYVVSACHRQWGATHTKPVRIGRNVVNRDLVLPAPDWPDQLVNGDMEEFGLEPGDMPGWKPYGIISGDGIVKSGWMKGAPNEGHPGFIAHSGEGLLGYVSCYNTKNGCTYQTVRAEPNALYELSAWVMTCRREGVRYDVANRIGIDPMGLDDPESPYIIWTPFRPSPDEWNPVRLQVRANRNRITVLLGHRMVSGIRWSGNLFDDVKLEKVAGPGESAPAGETEGVGDAHLPYPLE